MAEAGKFAVLRATRRVWAVGAIHGQADRLADLHNALADKVMDGDRLVYLGNVLGHGGQARASLDRVLEFRSAFIARPGAFVHDVALLRGAQEEMWHKLLQLQFAVNPAEVLGWMVEQGLGATIESYGGNVAEGLGAARQGPLVITRWTGVLRSAFQAVSGHQHYMSALSHAALTAEETLLFVSGGVDCTRPLDAQEDMFWWGTDAFEQIETPYNGFRRVVRGFDPKRRGAVVTDVTISLDGGANGEGRLIAACITPDGTVADMIEA